MNLNVAACTEVVAVLNDIINLLIFLLNFDAYLINLEGFDCLVQIGQRVEIVSSLVQVVSYFPKLLGLAYFLLLYFNHLLAK